MPRELYAIALVGWMWASPVGAAAPKAADALKLRPVQSDVPYQAVPESERDQCRVESLSESGWSGWVVTTADGTRLRRFADTNGDKKIDLWCYYDEGIEVYRDIDSDFNGKADQYRWLGTAGTRWGIDKDENGKIDYWKQISAEEATAELVAALAERDAARFARLLASESEIKSLGLGSSMAEKLTSKVEQASDGFAALAKGAGQLDESARWVQFASPPPGIVPSGTDGSTGDVRVYENAVAMYEAGQQSGQVLVGTLVQIGDAWRLVDLPQVVRDDQPLAQSSGIFFTPGGSLVSTAASRLPVGEETQALVSRLERIDGQLATADPDEQGELNKQRVDVVEQLIAASSDRSERETWMRQLVDTVSVAVQSGSYPGGLQRLRRFADELPQSDKEMQAYVRLQVINAEYMQKQTPDADFAKVQDWYLGELTEFVDSYPQTSEAGQALLQLALSKEFEEQDEEALEHYQRIVKSFSGTAMAERAAGAIRRLQSIGKSLPLRGRTLQGEAFDLAKLQGKPVVIHYWATWCEACKQDMKLLRQLQAKYSSSGLQVVGINVDSTPDQALGYLKQNAAPWVHLYDEGGLESSQLATQLGVQTLPMMLLIDASGRVVSNNIHAGSLDIELGKIAKSSRSGR